MPTAKRRGPPTGARIELAACVALAAVAFGLYARTGGFSFTNFDDYQYVALNPHVARGLGWSNVVWAFSTLEQEFWHPLTWLSYLADVSLFGLRPGPMHLVNAGLHAASSVLLFVALARLTRAPGRSAIAAALFAVHPAHVESVAWISERKDVLSVFFGLAAVIAYVAYARRPTVGRLVPVVAAYAASLMAKSTLVTLPFLLLLLDAWPLGRLPYRLAPEEVRAGEFPPEEAGSARRRGEGEARAIGEEAGSARRRGEGEARAIGAGWGRAVGEKLPLLAMSIASAWLTMVAQARGGLAVSDASNYRLGGALVSYVRYVGKLLWPADLAVFYPLPQGGEPAWAVLAALAVVAGITAAAVAMRRRAPWLTVGWLWFLGTLVPVSGIVQVGAHAMADRYTYFPSIGLFVAVVWGVGAISWRPLARAGPAVAAAALVLLAVRTDRQVRLWSDDERLFRHAIAVTGPNVRAEVMLANVLQRRGKDEEAAEHLREAVRLLPNPHTLTALGAVLVKLGDGAGAERAYRAAVAMDAQADEAAIGLADLLARDGKDGEATEVLVRAARVAPPAGSEAIPLRVELAAALLERGLLDEGVAVLEGARARAPGDPEVLSSLAQVYHHRGDEERAERYALQAVAGGAQSAGARLVLGAVRLARGDAAGAVEALGPAVELDGDEPRVRRLLAEALAGVGRVPEACDQWAFVLGSPRTTSEDRDRAARDAKGAGCGSGR